MQHQTGWRDRLRGAGGQHLVMSETQHGKIVKLKHVHERYMPYPMMCDLHGDFPKSESHL